MAKVKAKWLLNIKVKPLVQHIKEGSTRNGNIQVKVKKAFRSPLKAHFGQSNKIRNATQGHLENLMK